MWNFLVMIIYEIVILIIFVEKKNPVFLINYELITIIVNDRMLKKEMDKVEIIGAQVK